MRGILFRRRMRRVQSSMHGKEYMDKDVWREVVTNAGWNVLDEICSRTDIESELPWSGFDMNVGQKFLKDEYKKALKGELTSACCQDCAHQCGSCNDENKVDTDGNTDEDLKEIIDSLQADEISENKKKVKMLFFLYQNREGFISFSY